MLRVTLIFVITTSLPVLAYALWRLIASRRSGSGSRSGGEAAQAAKNDGGICVGPWLICFGMGLILSVLVAAVLAEGDGAPAGARYQPSVMRDGRIVPGRMIPAAAEETVPGAGESAE